MQIFHKFNNCGVIQVLIEHILRVFGKDSNDAGLAYKINIMACPQKRKS